MEILRWIGSTLVAVVVVSLIIGGGIIISLIGSVLWVIFLFVFFILLIAFGIKEHWEEKAKQRGK